MDIQGIGLGRGLDWSGSRQEQVRRREDTLRKFWVTYNTGYFFGYIKHGVFWVT